SARNSVRPFRPLRWSNMTDESTRMVAINDLGYRWHLRIAHRVQCGSDRRGRRRLGLVPDGRQASTPRPKSPMPRAASFAALRATEHQWRIRSGAYVLLRPAGQVLGQVPQVSE